MKVVPPPTNLTPTEIMPVDVISIDDTTDDEREKEKVKPSQTAEVKEAEVESVEMKRELGERESNATPTKLGSGALPPPPITPQEAQAQTKQKRTLEDVRQFLAKYPCEKKINNSPTKVLSLDKKWEECGGS